MADQKFKTVLVTGGTGFVAGWAIHELLKRGYHVRTTIRNRAKKNELLQTFLVSKSGV